MNNEIILRLGIWDFNDISHKEISNSLSVEPTKEYFKGQKRSKNVSAISKKNGWLFNWIEEYKQPEKEIYKLTIVGNQTVIQGLICIEIKADHVYIHLLENAPFNKGKNKMYVGVIDKKNGKQETNFGSRFHWWTGFIDSFRRKSIE